ncbi:branched-chain amino acid ABC transporter permease [Parapusillimonas granuli]|uniref:Branched-chain amino acid ABC transporter permease n=1 Tax=Parapusillimonas granuli TaxID=380911 RepID=A0A853FYQ3_9BURK|nr:branched-chain amino acid ABC transporter permease [Parapusillimonas granuli]MBB5217480.1 branched-chain amino acid transport system permease protein [Parapusillimonas granuli]MEB2401741.1 branched-chain amino acid ABC transporter permease [Alcaligenaceae bacterium]NYT50028.1 branched-chain amino acid ABC transporter permease [Parapusillimonas granuli]
MISFLKNNRYLLMAVASVLILPVALASGSLASEVLIFALAALGCNLLLGYAGLLSFGQGIFFGIGSYTLGILLTRTGLPMAFVLVLAIAMGAAVAGLVGWLAIRQKGVYFVMLTLALTQMFYFLAYSTPELTGGDNGLLDIPMPPLTVLGYTVLPNKTAWEYYSFVAILFLLAYWSLQRVVDSIFGRTLLAIRDNPARATALGYNIIHFKMVAFMLSGAITALAGALYAMMTGIAPLTSINYHMSEVILLVTVLGGTGKLIASVLGAAFYVIVSDWLSHLWPRWLLLFGLLLMAVSLYMQGGLWGAFKTLGEMWSRPRGARSEAKKEAS